LNRTGVLGVLSQLLQTAAEKSVTVTALVREPSWHSLQLDEQPSCGADCGLRGERREPAPPVDRHAADRRRPRTKSLRYGLARYDSFGLWHFVAKGQEITALKFLGLVWVVMPPGSYWPLAVFVMLRRDDGRGRERQQLDLSEELTGVRFGSEQPKSNPCIARRCNRGYGHNAPDRPKFSAQCRVRMMSDVVSTE